MTNDEMAEIIAELVKVTDQLSTIMESAADTMYLQTLNVRFLVDRVEALEDQA